MKKLVCEMCGSTELIKQDGVFVCQSCGCKYSVEEARKMMVEGTVEVTGTVKVDDTSKVDNYLDLSNTAYNAGNGQSAFDYANKALEIAPQNSQAWIAKMKAVEYLGTFGDLKLKEVVEAGKNAVTFADDSQKQDITFEVYNYEVTRALSLLKLATNKMSETADIENTFKRFSMISILTAGKNTANVDSKVVQLYDNVAQEAISLALMIPHEVLIDFPEISRIIGECAKQYQYVTDALIKRYAIYGAGLTDSALKVRKTLKSTLEKTCDNALKESEEKQKERNETYWQEHLAEKE
ncbi:MAG: TFIIB-type zinc finger domain-containing protein [Tannerellaceae bacterium]|nr:TFIIB-type zinc finger domain-containing protein [Tannerellaceae bacterium]